MCPTSSRQLIIPNSSANIDRYYHHVSMKINNHDEQLNSLDMCAQAARIVCTLCIHETRVLTHCWWLLGNKTSLSNRDWPASILVSADRVNTRGTNDPVATWRGQGLPRPFQGSSRSSFEKGGRPRI